MVWWIIAQIALAIISFIPLITGWFTPTTTTTSAGFSFSTLPVWGWIIGGLILLMLIMPRRK
jgi:hypothetical protein